MNNKICNPEKKINKTIEMNDCDYLNVILEMEKNMSNNLSIALNETSNNYLFDKLYDIFDEIKENAREAFDIMFKNGWYCLEEESEEKICEKKQELENKLEELEN